jgi:Zn finger protein HypA/HybF involved in hydrogenase expression
MTARTVSMPCPNCTNNLHIAPHITHFACAYCGKEFVALRQGGEVVLEPLRSPRRPLIDFRRIAHSNV